MKSKFTFTGPDGQVAKFEPNYNNIKCTLNIMAREVFHYYYDNPENMKRFEEWKAKRDAEREGKTNEKA